MSIFPLGNKLKKLCYLFVTKLCNFVTFSISLIFNDFLSFSNMVYKVTKFCDEIKRGVWGDFGGE